MCWVSLRSTQPTRLWQQSWLIHELGHVYQYQNNSNYSWIKPAAEGLRKDTYDYVLDPKKKFNDYRYEQQAEILEDYFEALKLGSSNLQDFEDLLNLNELGGGGACPNPN